MLYFLNLIRYKNLIIVALTQYIMRYCIIEPILAINQFELQFSNIDFFLLVMATVLLTAGGYVINDYFDTKTDILNHPETVIVGKHISRRSAMTLHIIFNVIAIILGFYISYKVGIRQLGIIFALISGLLFYYSTSYKRQFLIGNIIVAVLTAMVPLMVALYEIPLLNKKYSDILISYNTSFNSLFFWTAGFSFFAFLSTLIRELIKDVEDFEGDSAYGRNTVPIILGLFYAKLIISILIAFTIFSLFFIYFKYLNDIYSLLYFNIILILPFLFLLYKIITAKEKKDYTLASLISKIIMLGGICYAFVAMYNFNIQFS